ncbi:hypothetical protein E2C01_072168 [Portunus trituberculatus]|uniref:Uncharacterized protein n=1 Tax=Portunus trituberculatus TaxID=210409 RepID=A0A5B7I713_PORTR|nr:hypothetical protein [Portunus trituberculatus]
MTPGIQIRPRHKTRHLKSAQLDIYGEEAQTRLICLNEHQQQNIALHQSIDRGHTETHTHTRTRHLEIPDAHHQESRTVITH